MKVSIVKYIVDKLKRSLAIVQDGDTATRNIAKDKFVNWKGNIYTANQAIASGSTLSAASGGNLTACDDGALNNVDTRLQKLNSGANVTYDIIADALLVQQTMMFYGGGSLYTGNVPSQNYKYGTFLVQVRGGSQKQVVATSSAGEVATCAYDAGTWNDWKIVNQWASGVVNFGYQANISQGFETQPNCMYFLFVAKKSGQSIGGRSGIYSYISDGDNYRLQTLVEDGETGGHSFTVTATKNSITVTNGSYGGIGYARLIRFGG